MIGNWKIIAGFIATGLVAAGLILWVVFVLSPSPVTDTANIDAQFGTSDVRTSTGVTPSGTTNDALPVVSSTNATQKVFKISDGPMAGATLIDAGRPTTTVVRYVQQDNGHVFDLALDSPGAVPKAVSNITIPGIDRVLWSQGGRGAILQYLDGETIKTAHLALPAVGSTTPAARLQFLPANIADIAVSPDGTQIAYLIRNGSTSDGYVASASGTDSKKLFTLPLAQTLIAWPSSGTLVAQSASAAGVTGIAFSIDARTGSVGTLLMAPGLTANADRTLSRVLYQTSDGSTRASYAYTVRTGLSTPLSFDPFPERCVWSTTASSTLYCATPVSYVPGNYLDLWHLGLSSAPDAFIAYNVAGGAADILALPGSEDGGEQSNIAEFALAPREQFVVYVRKSDRSLWGIRLP